jgi:hypothetical protein
VRSKRQPLPEFEPVTPDGTKTVTENTLRSVLTPAERPSHSPLEDKKFFAQVSVNPEIGTIVWPNDVDFDPEVLYSQITGQPIPEPISKIASRAISGAGKSPK